MQRRDFLKCIVGSTAGISLAWPLAARAQQPSLLIVGYLSSFSANASYNAGFTAGLKEFDFVDGQNITIDYRYAEGRYSELPALAVDLVSRRVAAIFATGSNGPALAAKAATTAIPIVFVSGGSDPVRDGLVASINRPSGNVTGVSIINTALLAKRFEMLHQLVPNAATIGVLVNPNYPDADLQLREVQAAAVAIQRKIVVANARTEGDLDAAFAALVEQGANAFFTSNDPYFNSLRVHIVALAARYALPAAYFSRAFPAAGGLMSYGADVAEAYRQGGTYIGRILKGESPADLPVMQSSKFELIINLKTAKALGLAVPQSLLATADEVIE
jgi:putative ABC transport system substrate-binding protein